MALFIDLPDSIEGSFYHGKVCVGVKDSIFEPSSPDRHATELNSLLTTLNDTKPILLLYMGGGPDHHVNYITVQLSLIAIFLACDLHCLVSGS